MITNSQLLEMQARLKPKRKAGTTTEEFEPFDGPEADLHELIESDLKSRRWYYTHSRTDKKTTTRLGVTDFIIAAQNGMALWIEVKRKNSKLRPEQVVTKHILLALGHHWACVYSFKEYEAFVNGLCAKAPTQNT